MSRAKLLIAATLLALAILAGLFYWRVVRIHGFIVSLEPIDSERAVVCLRANDEYRQGVRAWVGLLDKNGAWEWSSKLEGVPLVGAHDSLLVHDGRVIVRTRLGESAAFLSAYALETGALLWRTSIEGAWAATYVDLLADGPRIIAGVTHGQERTVRAFDAATGKVAWSLPISVASGQMAPRFRGSTLLLEGALEHSLVASERGEARMLRINGSGCVDEKEIVYLHRSIEPTVVAAPIAGPGPLRTIVSKLSLPDGGHDVTAARCGRYKGNFVFTTHYQTKEDRPAVGLLVVDPTLGAVVGFFQVAWSHYPSNPRQDLIDHSFPDNAPLGGDLSRFVPLVVAAQEKEDLRLVVIDLEERRIVSRGPNVPAMLYAEILRSGERFYVSTWAEDATNIAQIDGKTGKLTAAIRVPHRSSLKPFHFRDGKIWIYDGDWRPPPLPYAVLNDQTLVPERSSQLTVVALSPDTMTTAWLGSAESPNAR